LCWKSATHHTRGGGGSAVSFARWNRTGPRSPASIGKTNRRSYKQKTQETESGCGSGPDGAPRKGGVNGGKTQVTKKRRGGIGSQRLSGGQGLHGEQVTKKKTNRPTEQPRGRKYQDHKGGFVNNALPLERARTRQKDVGTGILRENSRSGLKGGKKN